MDQDKFPTSPGCPDITPEQIEQDKAILEVVDCFYKFRLALMKISETQSGGSLMSVALDRRVFQTVGRGIYGLNKRSPIFTCTNHQDLQKEEFYLFGVKFTVKE